MKQNSQDGMNFSCYRWQSIIVFLNRRCTVGCPSCNVAAAPGNKEGLSPRWLSNFFDRIGNLNFSGYFLWTGGEPFFSLDSLLSGISLSAEYNFNSEILTSGIWYTIHPYWLEHLTKYRNVSLRISLDEEHLKKVGLETIISLVNRAWEIGVEVNFTLREIPGADVSVWSYISEIEKQLPAYYQANSKRSRWLHHIPHIPVCSNSTLSEEVGNKGLRKKGQKYEKKCSMAFRDLVIGADGLAYPCCGFFGLPFHQQLSIGDPLDDRWDSLAKKRFSYPLFKLLLEKGPYGVCQQMGLSPESWDWPPFIAPCHLCMALFSLEGERILKRFY